MDGRIAARRAALGRGLPAACIERPDEYGGAEKRDADQVQDREWPANSLTELADQLDC